MSAHPSIPELVALARGSPWPGATGSAARVAVRDHCLLCDGCRETLEMVILLRQAVGATLSGEPLPACSPTVQ